MKTNSWRRSKNEQVLLVLCGVVTFLIHLLEVVETADPDGTSWRLLCWLLLVASRLS